MNISVPTSVLYDFWFLKWFHNFWNAQATGYFITCETIAFGDSIPGINEFTDLPGIAKQIHELTGALCKSVKKFRFAPGMLVLGGKQIYNIKQNSDMVEYGILGTFWQPYSTEHWIGIHICYSYLTPETDTRNNSMFARIVFI